MNYYSVLKRKEIVSFGHDKQSWMNMNSVIGGHMLSEINQTEE